MSGHGITGCDLSSYTWVNLFGTFLFSASTASASPTFSGKIQMCALHDAPLFFDISQYSITFFKLWFRDCTFINVILNRLFPDPQPPVPLPTSISLSNPQQTAQITVSYPTPRSSHQQQTQPQKQRVFTGVVNKLHDTFGFVDEDVFFQLRYEHVHYLFHS